MSLNILHMCETRKFIMAILHWKQGLLCDKFSFQRGVNCFRQVYLSRVCVPTLLVIITEQIFSLSPLKSCVYYFHHHILMVIEEVVQVVVEVVW